MRRSLLLFLLPFFSLHLGAFDSQSGGSGRRLPGAVSADEYLLPNGWSISPAGEQIAAGDLPLALALHPLGKFLLVANNGYGNQSIDVIELESRKVVSQAFVRSID